MPPWLPRHPQRSNPSAVRIGRSGCSTTRNACTPSAETAVRFQPFWAYDVRRLACTTPAETPVRFRPFYTIASTVIGLPFLALVCSRHTARCLLRLRNQARPHGRGIRAGGASIYGCSNLVCGGCATAGNGSGRSGCRAAEPRPAPILDDSSHAASPRRNRTRAGALSRRIHPVAQRVVDQRK